MSTPLRKRSGVPALFAGLAVLFVARASLADHYHVPSGSMEPTVQVGDHVCVDKRAYGLRVPGTESYLLRWSEPARGDVVVLHSPQTGQVHAQIDATRVQRFERAELLHDVERAVIGEHDAAGPYANGAGGACDVRDEHLRCRAGDALHVVMLGQPKPRVAQRFCRTRDARGVLQSLSRGGAVLNREKFEHG